MKFHKNHADNHAACPRKFRASPFYCCAILLSFGLAPLGAVKAADLPPDGQKIYEKSCAKCHNPGPGAFFTGAPKIGSDVWPQRLAAAGSVDGLVASAAGGKGKMPAQGGASGLPDADLKAAIEYILSKNAR